MKLKQNHSLENFDVSKPLTNTLRYTAVFHLKYFSELVMSQTKEAFSLLCECEETVNDILTKTITIKFEKISLKSRIICTVLPEKIVFTTIGNTNADCVAILSASTYFLTECTRKAMFISGYVTYGHFYFNDSREIICGKPYIMADQMAAKIKINGMVCDKIVEQNLEEARMFTKDDSLFSQLGMSLLVPWDVPIYGSTLEGGLVKKSMTIVDWPRFSRDVFETIKSYSNKEFYTPFETIHGSFESLSEEKQTHINETLAFLNFSLSQTVKLFNSTL